MPNLEKILARRSGSAEEWYNSASESGLGGFIIPRATGPISDKKEPFLTLDVIQYSNESVLVAMDIRDRVLTMRIRLDKDGSIEFSPSSLRLPDGNLPQDLEEQTRKFDDLLGKYELEKEELIPLHR